MKSPIETQLRNAIRDAVPALTLLDDYTETRKLIMSRDGEMNICAEDMTLDVCGEEDPEVARCWVAMYADVRILSYRADILIDYDDNTGGLSHIVIECDGHDWHDRTKQDAARDRARDRELQRLGIPTMRFTGSEIHHDAFACATEVWQLVAILLEREARSQFDYSNGSDFGRRYAHEHDLPKIKEEAIREGIDIGFGRGVRHAVEAGTFDADKWVDDVRREMREDDK